MEDLAVQSVEAFECLRYGVAALYLDAMVSMVPWVLEDRRRDK
jgi:hypothetical protein